MRPKVILFAVVVLIVFVAVFKFGERLKSSTVTTSAFVVKNDEQEWIEQVSIHPRVFLWHSFLKPEKASKFLVVGKEGKPLEDRDYEVQHIDSVLNQWAQFPSSYTDPALTLASEMTIVLGHVWGRIERISSDKRLLATVWLFLEDGASFHLGQSTAKLLQGDALLIYNTVPHGDKDTEAEQLKNEIDSSNPVWVLTKQWKGQTTN